MRIISPKTTLELTQFVQGRLSILPFSVKHTDFHERLVKTAAMTSAVGESDLMKGELLRIPMGRFAEPREIAEAIIFLASPMSSYMSGASLIVDG